MIFFKTIRFQFTISLAIVFILLVSTISITLYMMNFRKHDYEILNLSSQLRLLAIEMKDLSENFLLMSTEQQSENSDLFQEKIKNDMELFERIIMSLKTRKLEPDLTNFDEPITCTWDEQSINTLDRAVLQWMDFKESYLNSIDFKNTLPSITTYETAVYFSNHGDILKKSAQELTKGFQYMMETKLGSVRTFNITAIAVSAVLFIVLLIILFRNILIPIKQTVRSFKKVESGALGHKLNQYASNEMGELTHAFNQLSDRLKFIFEMIGTIHTGDDIEESGRLIFSEFRKLISIDLSALFVVSPDGKSLQLETFYSESLNFFSEQDEFCITELFTEKLLKQKNLIFSNKLLQLLEINTSCILLQTLINHSMKSAVFIPINRKDLQDKAVLVLATEKEHAYSPFDISLIRNISPQIIDTLEKSFLFENLIIAAIEGLAKLAESRDPETGEHLTRMSLYSMIIARTLSKQSDMLTFKDVRKIYKFAPMHDIGKVGVNDSVLLKPGKLNDVEWSQMKIHPAVGGKVLEKCEAQVKKLGKSIFNIGIDIAKYHHEKWDGSGYPYQKKGEEIPISARIVSVADVFDALTSKRPYKEAWPLQKAIDEINSLSGKHFCPLVVEAFNSALPELESVYKIHKRI